MTYCEANPDKVAKRRDKYNHRSFMATPSWSETELIKELYLMRNTINTKYQLEGCEKIEVDHIVPLQGKTVCGLHVYDNLQLIDKSYNSSKGNNFGETNDV